MRQVADVSIIGGSPLRHFPPVCTGHFCGFFDVIVLLGGDDAREDLFRRLVARERTWGSCHLPRAGNFFGDEMMKPILVDGE